MLGGCAEYGRNCFYVEVNQQAILFDCGVMNDETQRLPNLEKRHVEKLQAVFISHLHKDHVGALSFLAELGYQGPVLLSETTKDWLPFTDTLQFVSFQTTQQAVWQQVTPNLKFIWGNSGHVLGSVWYSVLFQEKQVFFSGDVSLTSPLYPVDAPPRLVYDVAFIDSGNAGQLINNLGSKEEIRQLIAEESTLSFKIESKFTSKCVEILLYLFQTTKTNLFVDEAIEQWLHFHWKHRDNLLKQTQMDLQNLLASDRLQRATKRENGVYFLTKEQFLATKMEDSLNRIPFKNHLDTSDIYYVSTYLGATKTIYFHNEACTADTTLAEIIALNQTGNWKDV
ncbi:MBL fold metallo-hydrolase [Enterococcus saccharolyticus]|uniref:MBL fold metallo-hydrolase n=1 Tax=Enterococcus saccharolyticus TaxID=41997 RepID=UPI0023AAFAB1|nr:MBL fold metallo-hydrolase [Enterococcus saccharolyticus]